jgi:peptidoglycan/xylan/chitin deacetylase (PgdA/CDA1 family)
VEAAVAERGSTLSSTQRRGGRLFRLLERTLGTGGIVGLHGVVEPSFLPSVHITPTALQQQFEFLAQAYHVIPLSEFVARRKQRQSLNRCVAVTFDDAYTGVLEFALPLAIRYGIPFTVFVPTQFCDRGTPFWWDRLEWARLHVPADTGRELLDGAFPEAEERPSTWAEAHRHILRRSAGHLSDTAEVALAALERRNGGAPCRPMTSGELEMLATNPLVDFGSHTESHPALPALTDRDIELEITRSFRWLNARLPRVRPLLAYPYGLSNRRVARTARGAGVGAAFTIAGYASPPRFSLFNCPRIGIAEPHSPRGLRLRLARSTIPLLWLRHFADRSGLRPVSDG